MNESEQNAEGIRQQAQECVRRIERELETLKDLLSYSLAFGGDMRSQLVVMSEKYADLLKDKSH